MSDNSYRAARLAVIATSLYGILIALPALGAESFRLDQSGIALEIPDGWSAARQGNLTRIYSVPDTERASIDPQRMTEIVVMSVHETKLASHADAVQRLRELVTQAPTKPSFIAIDGWPALTRERTMARPLPGYKTEAEAEPVLVMTTGIAVANVFVRIEAWAPVTIPDSVKANVNRIAASLTSHSYADPEATKKTLESLRAAPTRGLPLAPAPVDERGASEDFQAAAARVPADGTTVRVTNQGGRDSEIELAVGNNGLDVVIGTNNGFFFSSDGGSTWAASAGIGSNDPSITWAPGGGPQGTFYAANIATPSTGFWTSTNGGANFAAGTAIYTCGQNGDAACAAAFPDQEHIVADRFNPAAGGDQIYSAWRHLDGNWGIVCSADGGNTWSANATFRAGDLPKVSIGQDGNVYVAYHPAGDDDILVMKFASCETAQNPMTELSNATVVANPTAVACPTPGLDRCNFRNSLASPVVAVDDTDPNHIYIAYARNTNPGGGIWVPNCANQNTCNENIVVQDSLDGGATWSPADPNRTTVVSSGVVARRFMPWACAAGGEVFVSWYDRTPASPGGTTVSNSSLTDFYRGSAKINAAGNLVKGVTKQINETGTTDAQCEAGQPTGTVANWPSVVDRPGDSESCDLQPQLAGICCVPGEIDGSGRCLMPTAASSQTRCDFNPDTCGAGETCASARGSPKYGDYNGAACGQGRFYMSWASAVAPAAVTPASNNIDLFFAAELVCCEPQIQVPAPVTFGETCATDSPAETLEVCNTGKEDLVVGSITSSNDKFTVTTPSAGFPVVISPDFCFSFEVGFDPSMGSQSGTLTIASNDPLATSIDVAVSADVADPDIQAAIANSGDFGNVCAGDHADLNLSLLNQGRCDLTISDIAFVPGGGSFSLPDALSFPLVLSPDADFNVPIRYAPDSCDDTPENATVRISSDDPDEDPVDIAISGVSGCPNLVIDPAGLEGLYAFPATVVDTGGTLGCFSERSLVLRNNGVCPLTITDIDAAAADFVVTAPTVFPILLPSGEETLEVTVRFLPQSDANPLAPGEITGTLTVASDDPDGDATGDLCGESVQQSGVRILVTDQSGPEPVPIGKVDEIRLQSKGKNTPSPINLRWIDRGLMFANVCGNSIQYHVDQETLPETYTTGSTPRSSYVAKAKVGNLQAIESFPLHQCEFRDFQLQLEDSDSGVCLLLPKGAACTTDGECCSGKCRGPNGAMTCR